MTGAKSAYHGPRWLPVALILLPTICAAAEVNRDCTHGTVLADGTCACNSCWTGLSCSRYASRSPKFARSFDTADLTSSVNDLGWRTIYRAEASDPDQEFCHETGDCPCAKVKYFIVSQDEASSFKVDPDTGDVSVNGDSHSLYSEYQLTLGVSDDGDSYDTMTLVVSSDQSPGASKYLMDMTGDLTGSGYSSLREELPLSRHKRAALPANVTFTLVKYGVNTNLTEIKVGVRIQFRLAVVFPVGTTDIQVELFAPDADSIVMALCDLKVTVGKNLNVSGKIEADMESMDNSLYNDRAIIRLGNVTNSGSDQATPVPSTVTVTYEAIMIDGASTVNNQEYWVSAGAEYNNENDVWVGQASFTAKTVINPPEIFSLPVVTPKGPSSLPIGSCGNYTIDLELNWPSVDVKFDLSAPYNQTDIMCVCSAKVISTSQAYTCGMRDPLTDYAPLLTADGNSDGFRHVNIDLGRPLNRLAREYSVNLKSNYKGVINIGVQFCMRNNPALVGNIYLLASTIIVGNNTIWAGTIRVTAADRLPSQVVTPVFYMYIPPGKGISQSKPISIDVSMEVPENSIADYILEVTAPQVKGQAIFQVCLVRIIFAGDNVACVGHVRKLKVIYSMSSNTSIYPDVARVDLGTIHNPGNLAAANFTDNLRNTVTFKITFKATNHPDAKVGSKYDVSFGMFVGDQKLVVGTTTLTVEDEPAAVNATTMPQFKLSLVTDGSSRLALQRTGLVLLDVRTSRNTTYAPFNIEFIMPNSSQQPLIRICKVKLYSVGANNPCVVAEGVERSVQMISSYNLSVTDRAVINMDSLCNIQLVDDEAEDHFVLAASVMLMNHPQFKTNPATQIDAGVMFNKAAVNVIKLDVQGDLTYNPPPVSNTPYLGLVPNNGNMTTIPWGAPFKYLVRIKTAPNDSTPLSLSVTTQDDAISLCSVRLVRAGVAYTCLEVPTGVVSGLDPILGINRAANIDLAAITNVGIDPLNLIDAWDSNTIELELVAKMTLDSGLAPDGSSHKLKVVLNYNAGYSSQVSSTVTVTASSATALGALPWVESTNLSASVRVASITGQEIPPSSEKLTTIVPSESKRLAIKVDTVANTTSNLSITVTTPTNVGNVLEILYIGLLYAGDNLPCVKSGQSKATYAPRQAGGNHSDIGTLVLGYVCNTGTAINDTSGTANTIQIESLVRMLGSAKLSPGSSVQIKTAIIANNQEVFVYNLPLTVGDSASFVDVYRENFNQTARIVHNSTEDPIVVAISELRTFPLVITVPPLTSSKISLDVVTPVRSSAIMTIVDVQVVRAGRNLPKLELCMDDFVITRSSEHNTSQLTKYDMAFGVVSNGGITYRDGRNMTNEADDTISVDVTLQMADHAAAIDQSKFNVSFGLHVTNAIFILDIYVTVHRTGSEKIVFNVSSAVDIVKSTSNSVEIDSIISLSNSSTAEGRDAILNLYLPVYVAHVSSLVTSPYKAITSMNISNTNVVTLGFGSLFFTDEIHLSTLLAPNGSHPVPLGTTGQDSVLALQPVANSPTEIDKTQNLDYINFNITTTTRGTTECAISALGMESGWIKDCQISSSADSIQGSEPVKGRYGMVTAWSPFVSTGTANEERYFQVFFGNKVLVTRLLLQQDGPSNAVTLNLRYSNDGLAWFESSSQSQMSPKPEKDQSIDVPSPQASRYLRVMITAMDNEKQKGSFRFEFIGCQVGNDGPSDPCSVVVTESPRLPDFTSRTFMKVGSTLYVSVGVKGSMKIDQKSYATSDDVTWRGVDSVGCFLGFDAGEGSMYAISSSGDSYLTSLDGDQWYSVSPDVVTAASVLPTYVKAVGIPMNGDPKLNAATPHQDYTVSGNNVLYGATVDGIQVNRGTWRTILTWAKCA